MPLGDKMKFPSEKELKKIRKVLNKATGSTILPKDASATERLKYDICKKFVIYKQEHNLNNRELSKIIEIDETLVSRILKYQIHRFTTDKLIQYLSKIHTKVVLTLKVS